MKKTLFPLCLLTFTLCLTSCGNKAEKVTLANEQDTLSWAMGMSLAQTLKTDFYDFNDPLVQQAFNSVLKGEEQPLDEQTYQAALQYINFLAQKHQREETQKKTAEAASTEAELFAQLEKQHPGIKKADEGYYYEVLTPGKGPRAKYAQRIKFDFLGTNMHTGDTLVKSYGGAPIVHVVGNPMFRGLQLGLQLMNAGSRYRFYFPNQLAYGAIGSDVVPPYTPVVYEIELHEIYPD